MPFKTGQNIDVTGQHSGKKQKATIDIKKLLRDKFPFKKSVKIIMQEAFGGIKRVNGNGVEYITAPNIEWMKMAYEYLYGKPTLLIDTDETTKTALESFKSFAREFSLPVPKAPAVNSSGSLVSDTEKQNLSTELSTQNEEVVAGESVAQ